MVRALLVAFTLGLSLIFTLACGSTGLTFPDEHVRTPIPTGSGVVFASQRGGTVTMTMDDGSQRQLTDGAPVLTGEELDTAAGPEQRVVVFLTEGGGAATAANRGTISNARLLTERRLVRLPDKTVGLFSSLAQCRGSVCQTEVWVLRSGGYRVLATKDAGTNVTVGWRQDFKQLAVGGGGLHVVNLQNLEVSTLHDFTAPAYSPDGTLYVRGRGSNDAVYRLGDELTVVAEHPGAPTSAEPQPVRFEAAGAVIVAQFARPSGVEVVKVRR